MSKEKFNWEKFEKDSIEKLMNGEPLSGKDGILTPLIKRFLEASLEGELSSHLSEEDVPNRRNGKGSKQVKTGIGSIQIDTPRDRNSSFDPQTIGKRQTTLNPEIDQKIISMYSRGMSYNDISGHIDEMYGLSVSPATLSAITDQVYEDVEAWRTRPLDRMYPVVWMDAIHFKVREDNQIKTKAVYSLIGINSDGMKDVLGLYIGQSEGARFWLGVLSNLKERGIEDILIACIDNLKGFAEAVEAIFPQTDVQLCIVHQVRNTMRFVPYKQYREVAKDMKEIYRAIDLQQAELALKSFKEKWESKYPHAVRSWENNWPRLSNYFKYPAEIRKLIYTTNVIEGYHAMLRKVTKTKRSFPSDKALMKLLYLVSIRIVNEKWNKPRHGWRIINAQLAIIFDQRYITHDTLH